MPFTVNFMWCNCTHVHYTLTLYREECLHCWLLSLNLTLMYDNHLHTCHNRMPHAFKLYLIIHYWCCIPLNKAQPISRQNNPRYHQKCFSCKHCGVMLLENSKLLYNVFVVDGLPYCDVCIKKMGMIRLGKNIVNSRFLIYNRIRESQFKNIFLNLAKRESILKTSKCWIIKINLLHVMILKHFIWIFENVFRTKNMITHLISWSSSIKTFNIPGKVKKMPLKTSVWKQRSQKILIKCLLWIKIASNCVQFHPTEDN